MPIYSIDKTKIKEGYEMSISKDNWLVGFSIPYFINHIRNGDDANRADMQEIISEIVIAAREDGYEIPE